MKLYTMTTSSVVTNTYILDLGSGFGAVVDPGGDCGRITAFLSSRGLSAEAVLLTHAHFDHTGAAACLQRKGAKIYVHAADVGLLQSDGNLAAVFGESFETFQPDVTVSDGDTLTLGDTVFTVLHTPGHTAGSVCYVAEKERVIFSGDTLFYLSAGRTDFPTGSGRQMLHSLRDVLFRLDGDYTVYPGHDRATTLRFEKEHNPYAARH